MTEFFYFVLFIAGLLMVIKGSDWFIDSAVWAAEVFRVPQIIIGATVISICTTLPETFVSATAAIKGEPAMAVGNALGSIGANIGLVLGILLLFTSPVVQNRKEFLINSSFLGVLLCTLWLIGFLFHQVSRLAGCILIIFFILYIIHNFLSAKKLMDPDIRYDIVDDEEFEYNPSETLGSMPEGLTYDEEENDFDISSKTLIKRIAAFILGIGFVLFGSNLLVVNGIKIAELLHVPTILVAVIFTSVGTSLPELITAITSIKKKVSNLGLGNLLGASILNIIQVTGVSALILPLPMSEERSILTFQLPFLTVMVISVICFGLYNKKKFSKWNGYWMIALYLVYLTVNLLREQTPFLGPILFSV
jgi:cation:H+ antiporter